MNRSLLIGIIATLALFSGIAIYFYLNNIKAKNKPATEAIPNDAFLIFQSRDILASWDNFSKSMLWSDLKQNAQLKPAQLSITALIKNIEGNDDIKELLSENTSVISLHNSNNLINFLAIVETGTEINASDIAKYMATKLNGRMMKRNFEKTPVFDITDGVGNNLVSFSFKENLLLCSPDANLIEEALRKIKYHIPNTTKGFEQVQLLAETGADANLYVNYQKLPLMFNHFMKSEYNGMFSYFKKFANWSMLDVELNQDQFKFTGVTYTDDSVFQFLDLFKNQTPKQLQLQQFMPKNTSMAFQMGFSDYLKFNTELNDYLQIHQKNNEYSKFTDSVENRYDIDLTQKVIPYIDGEAALVMTEPAGSEYLNNLSAFIRFKDAPAMAESLKNMVNALDKKGETDSVTYSYQGYTIERIKLGNFLKLYYGEIMENITSPYFTQINDVFVFANNENTLKFIIDEYQKGNTLANDEKYKQYEKTLAQNNNVSIFISPSRNFLLPANFVTDTFFSTLNSNQYDFKKFEFINIQFANTNNKAFYTQVQYKFNTVNTNETQLLWASKLDTTFDVAPQVVYNTGLKQNVIFVQDVKNTLYCLSTTGNLIWRSKLNGKLMGQFISIDVQKNGSLCYLFSTDKQANLIDEKGVSLYNFPVRYPGKAILPFTLFDFYNDSNQQFFVPLENNRIVAYKINGQPLAGFMPKVIDSKPVSPIMYFEKGSKKYVYTTSANGNLCLFDLKGKSIKVQLDIKAKLFNYLTDADSMTTRFYVIDTAGNTSKLLLDSVFKHVENVSIGKLPAFDNIKIQRDVVTQKDYYLLSAKNNWTLLNTDFAKITEVNYTDSILQQTYFTTDATGKVMLANYRAAQAQYYWYDMMGKLYIDFPINGNTPFNTANLMLDKNNYLIGGDLQNNIFVYKLK